VVTTLYVKKTVMLHTIISTQSTDFGNFLIVMLLSEKLLNEICYPTYPI